MRKPLITHRAIALAMFIAASVVPLRSFESRLVAYDIDGTAKIVSVTWNVGTGSSEQRQLKLPVHETFQLAPGSLAYCAAQKITVYGRVIDKYGNREVLNDGAVGTVHVELHVNYQRAGEATADAPFGIAKVSAEVK